MSHNLNTRNIPCRVDPDLWFSDSIEMLGRAKHICLRHCAVYELCGQDDLPMASGIRAGVRWNKHGDLSTQQPIEIVCSNCADPDKKRCANCGATLKPGKHKYCSAPCRNVLHSKHEVEKQKRLRAARRVIMDAEG